jgi:uncharacterized OB-fold protein
MSDEGYDEWLDAVDAGEAFYLACSDGHGSLPPRRTCPHCGAFELHEESLPETGEVATYTVVHVGAPDFADETPYVTAIAEFGNVRLTGILRNVAPADLDVGMTVEPKVGVTESTGQRRLELHPR